MTATAINWPGLTVLLIVFMVLGFSAVISPITIIRLAMSLTEFVLKRIQLESNWPKPLPERLHLLRNNPEEYKRQYWLQMLGVRIGGCLNLFLFLIGLLLVLVSIT